MANLKIHIPITNGPSGDQLCAMFQYYVSKINGKTMRFAIESSYLAKYPDKAKIAADIYKIDSKENTSHLLILEVNSLAIVPMKNHRNLWHIEFSCVSEIDVIFTASGSYNPYTRKGMIYCGEVFKPNHVTAADFIKAAREI